MRNMEDRESFLEIQPPDQLVDLHLMIDVQVGSGLIEQDDLGFLGQGPGDQDPLPLPLAQLPKSPLSQTGHIREGHGLMGHIQVLLLFPAEAGQVRRPSHEDDLPHSERKRNLHGLRHHGDLPGHLRPGNLVQVPLFQQDSSPLGPEQPIHQFQEGGLARTVGPNEAQNLPSFQEKA